MHGTSSNTMNLHQTLSIISLNWQFAVNELNDMADEEEGSGGEMDEEVSAWNRNEEQTASIITQSLLQVRNVRVSVSCVCEK